MPPVRQIKVIVGSLSGTLRVSAALIVAACLLLIVWLFGGHVVLAGSSTVLPPASPTVRTGVDAVKAVGIAHAELITVTDTAAAWSWVTVDDDGAPAVGPAGASVLTVTRDDLSGGLVRRVESSGKTPYQYAEIRGLSPGTVYRWRIEVRGGAGGASAEGAGGAAAKVAGAGEDGAATVSSLAPVRAVEGVFLTYRPPVGRKLFSFAVLNDLHVGEKVSRPVRYNQGLRPGDRGFLGDPPKPYWEVMLRAAVQEVNRRRVDFVVVNGDVTSGGRPEEVAMAKSLLDRLAVPYYVARGNHDRPLTGRVGVGAGTGDGEGGAQAQGGAYAVDPFAEAFGRRGGGADGGREDGDGSGGPMNYAFSFGGVDFIVLDLADPRTGIGRLTGETEDWLEARLAETEREGKRAFIFAHHNVSTLWVVFGLPVATHSLPAKDAARLMRVVGRHKGVVAAVISGHSHRNRVTWTTLAEGVPLVENAALKEYPGGYSIITVYDGGWMRAFWRVSGAAGGYVGGDGGRDNRGSAGDNEDDDDGDAGPLQWVERTRGQFFGAWPAYAFGDLADRCGVYRWE